MKICHVISGYYRNDARNFQRQARSLVRAGHEVVFVTNDGLPHESLDGIPFFPTTATYPRWRALLFAKRQFLDALVRVDADVYQLHAPELLPLVFPLKRLHKKVVYDAHEDLPRHIWEKEWIPRPLRRPLGWLIDKYMRYVLEQVDEVISPHNHVINQFRSSIGKGTVITNFPLLQTLESISRESFLARDSVVCYTGTVYAYSNQEEIVDAVGGLPQVRYVVAGYVNPEHQASLQLANGGDRVTFMGRIDKDALRALYLSSVAGLAIYEYKHNLGWNLGSYATNKVFEYMEAGIPLICTDFVLWQELIEKWDCGICVKPNDTRAIQDAIRYLMENRARAYEMGQNGRRAIEAELNWRSQESKYLEVFERIA